MSIKMKLSSAGGYVVGDGDCPFDPDQFFMLFMNRIIEAQKQGLDELEISDEEIARQKVVAREIWLGQAKSVIFSNNVGQQALLTHIDRLVGRDKDGGA